MLEHPEEEEHKLARVLVMSDVAYAVGLLFPWVGLNKAVTFVNGWTHEENLASVFKLCK